MGFSRIANLDHSGIAKGYNQGLIVDLDGDFLYSGYANAYNGSILKIRLQDFTIVSATASQDSPLVNYNSSAIDANYVYYVCARGSGDSAYIVRYSLSSFLFTSSLYLGVTSKGTYALFKEGTDLYCGTNDGHIVKVNLNTWTVTSSLTVAGTPGVDDDRMKIRSFVKDGAFIYAGTNRRRIHKIDITNFAYQGYIDLASTENGLFTAFSDGQGFIYFGGGSDSDQSVRLYKINVNTFSLDSTLIVNASGGAPQGGFVDTPNLLGYIGYASGSKYRFAKIDLATFTVIDEIIGGPGVGVDDTVGFHGVAVKSSDMSAYLGTNANPSVGRTVKFDVFTPSARVPVAQGGLLRKSPPPIDWQAIQSRLYS